MKKNVKRLFASILAILLLSSSVGVFGVTATAGEPITSGVWEYVVLEDDTIKIVGYNGRISTTEVEVPQTIDEKQVTEIGEAVFEARLSLKKVALPEGLKKIGNGAFYGSQNITEINWPTTLVDIGDEAFWGCAGLTEVDLPEGLLTIGASAFEWCFGLDVIEIPKSVTEIGENAFSLEGYSDDYPNTITIKASKGSYAETYAKESGTNFEYSDGTEEIIVVEKDVVIVKRNYKAFETVTGNDIYIKLTYDNGEVEELKDIEVTYQNGDSLRFGDTYFKVVAENSIGEKIEETIDVINDDIIIENEDGEAEIGNIVVVKKALPNYTIPTNLMSAPGKSLSEVDLPDGFEWTEENPDKITLEPGDRTYKAKYTPEDTNNFEIVKNIPVTVMVDKYVPEYTVPTGIVAEQGITLQYVKLPENFKWMNAREEVSGEGEVIYKAKYIPNDTENYKAVEDIPVTIWVPKKASNEKWEYTILDNKNNIRIDKYLGDDSEIDIASEFVGYKVKEIGQLAFVNSSVEKITLPDGIIKIGREAFYDCRQLKTVNLPNSLTEIGIYAFSNCKDITLLVCKDSYAEEYAKNNGIAYKYVFDLEKTEVQVELSKTSYKAFQEVDVKKLSVKIRHEDGSIEEISKDNFEIKYVSGKDSFRRGDTQFIVLAHSATGETAIVQVNIEPVTKVSYWEFFVDFIVALFTFNYDVIPGFFADAF